MVMPARRRDVPPAEELIPFTLRMPRGLISSLDAWVEKLNKGKKYGLVTRSDVIRYALEQMSEKAPPLDGK